MRGFQPRLLDDASETERRTASTSSPLVDIGERFGMGLADLYGHWKKYSLPEPVISEEYDPDRVKITVYTDSDQGTANRPKSVPRVPKEISDAPSSVKQVYLAMHEDVAITHRGLESKLGLSKTTIRKRHEWFIGQFEKGQVK